MINLKKIAFGASLMASASAMATAPMHFEYSWEGFTNTATGIRHNGCLVRNDLRLDEIPLITFSADHRFTRIKVFWV